MIPQSVFQHLAKLASGPSTGYYLYIKEIPGTAKGAYAGWMEIDSFSWGSTRRVGYSDITIVKAADKASTQLMLYTATGNGLEKVLLDIVGDKKRLYRITLKDVIVSSFISNKNNTDTFSLDYVKIDFAVV